MPSAASRKLPRKLRQQAAQRVAELQLAPRPAAASAPIVVETAPIAVAPAPEPVYEAPVPMPAAEINQVSLAPAAPKPQPIAPQPVLFDDAPSTLPVEPEPAPYVPPRPEVAQRPVRMPTISELPMPAQQQFASARPAQPAAVEQRKGLLQRLAGLGMTRREDDGYADATPVPPVAAEPPRRAAPAPQTPAYQPGQLDQQGRAQPRTSMRITLKFRPSCAARPATEAPKSRNALMAASAAICIFRHRVAGCYMS